VHLRAALKGQRGTTVLGVDWSGAAKAGTKIWFATLEGARRPRLTSLGRPFLDAPDRDAVYRAFASVLRAQRARVVGLDFCFGIESEQVNRLHRLAGLPPPVTAPPWAIAVLIDAHVRSPEDFRDKLAPEKKRVTDARAPFAPTNLRMFRQTWLGIRCLGTLGPRAAIHPWSAGATKRSPLLVEVLPAQMARTLGVNGGYKGKSVDAMRARARLVDAIRTKIDVRPNERTVMIADREGDAIDAVLAAWAARLATARALQRPEIPASALEGWIVP
jgi:hypothetical protein